MLSKLKRCSNWTSQGKKVDAPPKPQPTPKPHPSPSPAQKHLSWRGNLISKKVPRPTPRPLIVRFERVDMVIVTPRTAISPLRTTVSASALNTQRLTSKAQSTFVPKVSRTILKASLPLACSGIFETCSLFWTSRGRCWLILLHLR